MTRKEDVWEDKYLTAGTTFDWCYRRTLYTGDIAKYQGQWYKRVMIEGDEGFRVAFIKWEKDKRQ